MKNAFSKHVSQMAILFLILTSGIFFVSILLYLFQHIWPIWRLYDSNSTTIVALFLKYLFIAYIGLIFIIHYKIRIIWPLIVTTFISISFGFLLSGYLWFGKYFLHVDSKMNNADYEDWANVIMRISVLVLLNFLVIITFVDRAKWFFSENTNRWLQQFVLDKHLFVNNRAMNFQSINFNDIINSAKAVDKKNYCVMTLHVSQIKSDRHFLEMTFKYRTPVWYSTSKNKKYVLPIDYSQLLQLKEIYGPAKKIRELIFLSLTNEVDKI